jgi:hypothetical protein
MEFRSGSWSSYNYLQNCTRKSEGSAAVSARSTQSYPFDSRVDPWEFASDRSKWGSRGTERMFQWRKRNEEEEGTMQGGHTYTQYIENREHSQPEMGSQTHKHMVMHEKTELTHTD